MSKKVDVDHLASLSNLHLSPQESTTISTQFPQTIAAIDKLSKVDTKGVVPTHHTTGLVNVTRDDKIDKARVLSQAQALSGAKVTHRGFFVVKGVINEA